MSRLVVRLDTDDASVPQERVIIKLTPNTSFIDLVQNISDMFQHVIPSDSDIRFKYFDEDVGVEVTIMNDIHLKSFTEQYYDPNVKKEHKELIFKVMRHTSNSLNNMFHSLKLVNSAISLEQISNDDSRFVTDTFTVKSSMQQDSGKQSSSSYASSISNTSSNLSITASETSLAEELLKKKYTSLQYISSGAFGSVYSVIRQDNNQPRAIKIIKVDHLGMVNDALQEFRKLMQMNHEHIVRCFDTFLAGSMKVVGIEMELMLGSLFDLIIKQHIILSENLIIAIIRQICDALQNIQKKNIVHRDIKPHNILVRKFNPHKNEIVVALGDFGLARTSSSVNDTTFAGTEKYFSPEIEQYRARGDDIPSFSFASDVFALGVTIYQLMTFDMVISWSTLVSTNSNSTFIQQTIKDRMKGCYSDFLVNLIDCMLKQSPTDRFTIGQILKQLPFATSSTDDEISMKNYNLGLLYYKNMDFDNGIKFFEVSANRGHSFAQNYLGLIYENGKGVSIDFFKAFEWFQKAAYQGHASAQFNLGHMYENGKGVSKDYLKAIEWFQKAANQGHKHAQNNLGLIYENGKEVSQDYLNAFEWFQKAANQGHASAQFNLGHMYENGKGVSKDYLKAAKWYKKAASQGHRDAQFCLGLIYENGKGVSQDNSNLVGEEEFFHSMLNDYIHRNILSYLECVDLMKLQVVSKSLRLCQLTEEDQFWRDYYLKKITELREATATNYYEVGSISRAYDPKYDSLTKRTENFKKGLIQIFRENWNQAEKNSKQLTIEIEKVNEKDLGNRFFDREAILEYPNQCVTFGGQEKFKVVAVGDEETGKTSLLISYVQGYHGYHSLDFMPLFDTYNHQSSFMPQFSIGLWDTLGLDYYSNLRPHIYPDTDLFLLTFSVGNKDSLLNIAKKWIPEIRKSCLNAPILLIGTKSDLRKDSLHLKTMMSKYEKPVTKDQGEMMARRTGCITYIETSAKVYEGFDRLDELFIKVMCVAKNTSLYLCRKDPRVLNDDGGNVDQNIE